MYICSRLQLFLVLAYGRTVHRAQGSTLQKLCFNISKAFACGQVYSALARAVDFVKVWALDPYPRIQSEVQTESRLLDNSLC